MLNVSGHFLLASIEGFLFFLVIVIISAVSNWLKQKQQKPGEDGEPDKDGPSPRPAGKIEWEAELRQLLEGKRPSPPPPASEPPPLVAEEAPPSVPPPLAPARSESEPPRPPRTPTVRPVPATAESTEASRLGAEVAASEARLEQRLAGLQASRKAYERAQQLDQSVAARLKELEDLQARTRKLAQAAPGGRGVPAARRVREMLRRPATVRDAIVAAEILGQPKGLQF